MKNFKINNLIKSLLSVFLIILMTVPIDAFASTNLKGQDIVDSSTTELIGIFPEFKTSLDKYTTGELVSNIESYYKFTPKSNANIKKVYTNNADIEKDFHVKKYTKQEYEVEVKNDEIQQAANELLEMSSQSIGNQQGGTTSWLKMTLNVYNATGLNDYMAYNFTSWLTSPIFRLKDAIGISLSEGLILSSDRSSRTAIYNYNTVLHGDTTVSIPTEFSPGGAGVIAQFSLASRPGGFFDEYNNAMISTGIVYSGSNIVGGWILGNYLHSELSFGSIGIDAAGIPYVSASISSDLCQGAVSVKR